MKIEEIARRIAAFPQVQFAFLFGSQAVGRARPDSDIDVGIFLAPETTSQER